MRLGRDDILKADDIRTETVEVPEWGGEVLVRGLSGAGRDRWEAQMMEQRGRTFVPNLANMRARLVAACIVDEQGRRIFTDQDADALGEKSGSALNRTFEVASKLSGIGDQDLEDLAKDFHGPTSNGSSSSSASPAT